MVKLKYQNQVCREQFNKYSLLNACKDHDNLKDNPPTQQIIQEISFGFVTIKPEQSSTEQNQTSTV